MGIPISRLNPAPSLLIGDYLPISTPDPSSPTGFSTFKATFEQVGEFIQVGPTGPTGPPGPVSPAQPSDIILSGAGLVGGMAAGPAQLITVGGGLSLSGGILSSLLSFSDPTAVIGLSAVNGVSASSMRSDSAPALSQAIVPTWSGLHTFSAGISTIAITLPVTTDATHGLIIQSGSPLLHTFAAGIGDNIFIGGQSGNFTMTGSDRSTGVGFGTLTSLTTGNINNAFGYNCLHALQDGTSNFAAGTSCFASMVSGSGVCGVGVSTGIVYNGAGPVTVFGGFSLLNLTTGTNNVVFGYNSGNGITTGSSNTILGGNVVGLASGLSNSIIIADGGGNIRLDYNKTLANGWVFDAIISIVTPPSGDNSTKAASTAFVASLVMSSTQFGFVGDGATDNSTAWNTFSTFAQAKSALGIGVVLDFVPGTYNFDHSLCQLCLYNIKNLVIRGNGSTFQNTYNQSIHGANFNFENPWPPACHPNFSTSIGNGKLISTTAIGDLSVTLLTPADNSAFAVNDWVMVASLDTQYSGFPINPCQFDYVQITAINTGTGVMSFSQPLKFSHRSDFPDGNAVSFGGVACGAARVWQINYSLGTSNPTTRVAWDIDHTYMDLTVLPAPASVNAPYTLFIGQHIRTINWKGAGHVESSAGFVEHENAIFQYDSEPDKLVEAIHYTNCRWTINTGITGLNFQSASIYNVHIDGGAIAGTLGVGAKNLLVENAFIGTLKHIGHLGPSSGVVIRNCQISAYPFPRNYTTGATDLTIDGVNISFANGLLTIVKAGHLANLITSNVAPGMQLQFCGPDVFSVGQFPGDLGHAFVTDYYEDSTNIYIKTTFPFAALPSWANGKIRIIHNPNFQLQNCTGCDNARLGSYATSKGKKEWELFHFMWLGKSGTNGFWNPTFVGKLIKVKCNVLQVSPVANTTLTIILTKWFVASTMADPSESFSLVFNINIAGAREITTTTYTGQQSGDLVKVNAGTVSFLPTDRLFGGTSTMTWGYANLVPSVNEPWQNPVIDFEMEFDTGIFRAQGLTLAIDQPTSNKAVGAVTGSLL